MFKGLFKRKIVLEQKDLILLADIVDKDPKFFKTISRVEITDQEIKYIQEK